MTFPIKPSDLAMVALLNYLVKQYVELCNTVLLNYLLVKKYVKHNNIVLLNYLVLNYLLKQY